MDGHGTDPYEQKTQQSPALGRSTVPQPAHWWKKTQASAGISNASAREHSGQVSTDVVCNGAIGS
jgi:hypothetical protein